MPESDRVLVVGGTGRTGGRVLEQLVARGVGVRAIVRSAGKVPPAVAGSPLLAAVEADLLALSDADLRAQVEGCTAVVSCLGHVISLKGVLGPPRDLVTAATQRLCRAVEASRPPRPVRFALMSAVSVNHPGGGDLRRGAFERALVGALRAVLPPAKDNQRAADFLWKGIGTSHPHLEWTVVRPDTLLEGEVTPYELHEDHVASVFAPDQTNRANVAHFLCELATSAPAWERWKGKLPVITNARPAARAGA